MKKKSKYRFFYHFIILLIFFLNHHSLYAANITFWESKKDLGVEVSLPDWALEKDVSSTEEKGIKLDGKLYSNIIIFKPAGDPKNWSHFFSIQIESEIDDPLRNFKDLQLEAYINYCKKNSLRLNLIKETSDQIVFSVFCGNYKHNKNRGEVAVFSMVKFRSYFIKVFHQWQSEKIEVNDNSTWSASNKEISKIIGNISSLKIHFKK